MGGGTGSTGVYENSKGQRKLEKTACQCLSISNNDFEVNLKCKIDDSIASQNYYTQKGQGCEKYNNQKNYGGKK